MGEEFSNWSGSLRFTPNTWAHPESTEDLQEIVREVAARGGHCHVAGKGHSSSPVVQTDDTLISLEKMAGVESVDTDACEAWVRPGTMLKQMGAELLEEGVAVHNLGDVDVQQLGGAIGTGTHGTGKYLGNLSTMLLGVRMVTADGTLIERHIEDDADFILAARVALGTLGIFTSLRIRVQPAYRLHRVERCASVDDCFDNMTWLAMEYCLPAMAGPIAFQQVRRRMLDVHRREVAWRLLYRTTAPDDAFLSSSHKRDTAVISVHHNAQLPHDAFFADIEPILQSHHGRPHWGKKHSMRGAELARRYPDWQRFLDIRQQMDPEGVFLTDYLRELFGL